MVGPRSLRSARIRKVTPRLIRSMARRLIQSFNPDQIILFGSQARGTATPDSDVDLMVVMPIERSQKPAAEVAMGVALHDIRIPMDILVVTSEELERHRNIPGTIVWPALREGKILYARR